MHGTKIKKICTNILLLHFRRVNGKAIPVQAWTGPVRFQEDEAPRLHDKRHMTVVR
jgi:hypothetical protein